MNPKLSESPRQPLHWGWTIPPLLIGLLVMVWLLMLSQSHALWERENWTLQSAQWPVFSDLNVMREGIRLHAQGGDPLTADTQAQGFVYNYPRIWLMLSHAGVHKLPPAWTGFALGVMWLGALIGVARIRSAGLSVLMIFALLSPPVILALERGNTDLILFMLCCVTALQWSRPSSTWLAPCLVALGGMLKLYPAAALSLAWFDVKNRSRLRWWITSAVIITGFWLLRLDELGLIGARTPRATGASFGCAVVPMRYVHYFESMAGVVIPQSLTLAGSMALFFAWLSLSAWIGHKMAPAFARMEASRTDVSVFYTMTAVWIGAFALGNNFDYRLIFVLPCLPLLWRVCTNNSAPPALWRWSALSLAAAFVVFSSPLHSSGRIFIVSQTAGWLLAGTLAAGCFGLIKADWMNRSGNAPAAT